MLLTAGYTGGMCDVEIFFFLAMFTLVCSVVSAVVYAAVASEGEYTA
jgi:hypothetical protein